MGKFRNVLKNASYAFLLAINSSYVTDPAQRKLNEIMKKQEEIMDIEYSARPVLILKRVPEISEKLGGVHRSGIIEINSSYSGMWGALSHELGHFYVFLNYSSERNNRLSKVSFRSKISQTEKNVIRYFTDEGIAAYFEYRTMNSLNCKRGWLFSLDIEKLRKGREEYGSKEFEELACEIVKPILDVNVDKGIETIIKNPMNEGDLEDIIGYQQRILKIVRENSSR